MKVKLSIFSVREWTYTGTDKDGNDTEQTIYVYTAFTPDGDCIDFSTDHNDHKIFKVFKYSPEHSEEVDIEPKAFMGKVKYREAGATFLTGGGKF